MFKTMKHLVLYVVLFAVYAANAGVIVDSGVSIGLSLGANWVFEEAEFTENGLNPVVTNFKYDHVGPSGSLYLGYTSANSGVGANLEVQYNSFNFLSKKSADAVAPAVALYSWEDAVTLNALGAFINIDLHTDFGANCPIVGPIMSFYASAGIGFIRYVEIVGSLYSVGMSGSTAPQLGSLVGDSDMLYAFKFKIGGEVVMNQSTALGSNIGVMCISSDDAIHMDNLIIASTGLPPDSFSLNVPQINNWFIELKLTHFFVT